MSYIGDGFCFTFLLAVYDILQQWCYGWGACLKCGRSWLHENQSIYMYMLLIHWAMGPVGSMS